MRERQREARLLQNEKDQAARNINVFFGLPPPSPPQLFSELTVPPSGSATSEAITAEGLSTPSRPRPAGVSHPPFTVRFMDGTPHGTPLSVLRRLTQSPMARTRAVAQPKKRLTIMDIEIWPFFTKHPDGATCACNLCP